VLAVAGQPLQAHACDMDMDLDQHQDHSTMQMSHPDGADSDCCDPEGSDAADDCAGAMGCGSCFASTSMISNPPQTAPACLQTAAVDMGSGGIPPSHSSPPYHPPTS
jgi:hypothetical protein